MRENLGIPRDTADRIAYEVLEPYRKKKQSLQSYEETLYAALREEYPLSKRSELELRHLQSISGLQDEDVEPIRSRLISEKEVSGFLNPLKKENQNDNVELNQFVASPLPVVNSDSPESPGLSQALPSPALVNREGSEGKSERLSFTVSVIALGAFISTIALGVFAYQYLWKGWAREPAIAFQSASFSPTGSKMVGGFVNNLVIYIQELNREGVSSGHSAWTLYTKFGDINGAIQALEQVHPASSEYADAQERLAVWPKAFEKNRQNLNLSQTALNNGRLTEADNYANALDSTQDYWKTHQQDLLARISQERVRVALLSHRLICGTRNKGTTLSQFRVNAQGIPISDSAGELDLVEAHPLLEGTEVALTSSPASSEMSDSDLTFVEVKDGPSSGKRGWVDSKYLCRLSD